MEPRKNMFVLTDEKIASWLGHTNLLRGKSYHQDNRITQMHTVLGTLRGNCTGTAATPYTLWVGWKNNGISDGNCTCPVGREGKCKHVAALLLNYRQAQGFVSPPASPVKAPKNQFPSGVKLFPPQQSQPQLQQPQPEQNQRDESLPPQAKVTIGPLTRRPGFSLEEWKEREVKQATPKKRKTAQVSSSRVASNDTTKSKKELQEMKLKNILLQWQIHVLRQKLAVSESLRLKEFATDQVQDVVVPQKQLGTTKKIQPQAQQTEGYIQEKEKVEGRRIQPLPLLATGRELKERNTKTTKRKRTVLDKTFRPLKKQRSASVLVTNAEVDPSAIFSQHNKDVEKDFDINTTSDATREVNPTSNTDTRPRQEETSKERKTDKTKSILPPKKKKPFFDVNDFLDVEASEGTKKRYLQSEDSEDDAEENDFLSHKTKQDSQQDVWNNNNQIVDDRRSQERRDRQRPIEKEKEREEDQEEQEDKDKEEEKEEEEKDEDEEETNIPAVSMMSTQEFISFISGESSAKIKEVESEKQASSSLPRTSALTNLMQDFVPGNSASPIKLDFDFDFTCSQQSTQMICNAAAEISAGMTGSQLDSTLQHINLLLAENGLSLGSQF
eukprot:TRINITY_DN328_c2_g1_i1.p1 TRINITY_DN328_c2_g1~~TRINITY_DN328_c2_g1_i1.p1  ORF type:complete len:619 (-),score=146.33 TRINITY_DN328_c2_g1_i1:70-1905(-)